MLFSASVTASPYVMIAVGLLILIWDFPNFLLIVTGLAFVGIGVFLRRPRLHNTRDTLGPEDAPKLFDLLNHISRELGAPRISGVHVVPDFNAYIVEFGKSELVVGIGAPLWKSLSRSERIALLAHEVAHQVSNDPSRGNVTSSALFTLYRWSELLQPPAVVDQEAGEQIIFDDRGLMSRAMTGLFSGAFDALALAFEKMIFVDSQRAEYLADIKSANVAGATASKSLLKKVILAPLAERVLNDIYYDGRKHISVFDKMADAVREPDPQDEEKAYSDALDELHTVDRTHPPTRFRMEVVGVAAREAPAISIDDFDWPAIDAELSAAFLEEEKLLLNAIIVQ